MTVKHPRMKRFFSRLSYSFGNEDWRTEQQALKIEPDSEVLCISASGDRSLHLLLDECARVTSIDANPIQNHLLHLKRGALQALNYDEYVGFLGGEPHGNRKYVLSKILPYLEEESSRFWRNNEKLIEKGIIYQGTVEKLSKNISRVFRLIRPKKMKKIFSMHALEEQRTYLKTWDTKAFKKMFDVLLSPKVCKALSIDPGLDMQDPDLSLGSYIYERMLHSLNHCLAKDNLLISLIFRGYVEPSAFPPYLNREGSALIKQRLDKLSIRTQEIIEHLEEMPPNSYDRYSLSDVASYLSKHDFERLIANVYRTAKPKARFCFRQFSSNQKIPLEYQHLFRREPLLEKRLEESDRCFVYRFMVGEIQKFEIRSA